MLLDATSHTGHPATETSLLADRSRLPIISFRMQDKAYSVTDRAASVSITKH